MFAFIEIFLIGTWVVLGIPTGAALLVWRHKRKSKRGEPMGGCLLLSLIACGGLALLLISLPITAHLHRRPETMAKNLLGISHVGPLQNLKGHYEDVGIDYTAYLYFEASEAYVRDLIREGGFERDSTGGLVYLHFSPEAGAPPFPGDGGILIHKREGPESKNHDTLVTDAAHERVWFVSVDY